MDIIERAEPDGVTTGEWVWGELPNKSNISVDVCPGCDHLTTRHIEVTSFDLEARTGTFIYTPCTDCDCNHYLD